MDEDGSLNPEERTITQVSPAARIRELIEIDKDLTKVLQSAGDAFRALTAKAAPDAVDQDAKPTLDEVKENFASHANDFFTTVQSIGARMRRQAYALDEANIIPKEPPQSENEDESEKPKDQQPSQAGVRSMTRPVTVEPPMPITNGGLGNLDVGWLNSRRDEVGKQKEAELWHDARIIVEKFQKQQEANGSEENDKMDVDSPQP